MSENVHVVFPIFPNVDALDFAGPHEVFFRTPGVTCEIASLDGGSIKTDNGIVIGQSSRLADVQRCTIVCVPGGQGHVAKLEDRAYLEQLRRLAATARFVTSVCTGALLLGAAGLLRGKRAACHWAWRDLLSKFGAIPDPARVVRDGNIVTSGGVTAGIDMAFTVVAEIVDESVAKRVQLGIEYAPEPLFNCGTPETADADTLAAVQKHFEKVSQERAIVVSRAAKLFADRDSTPSPS